MAQKGLEIHGLEWRNRGRTGAKFAPATQVSGNAYSPYQKNIEGHIYGGRESEANGSGGAHTL